MSSGWRPCITCKNVFAVKANEELVDGMVGLNCAKRENLVYHTNESVFSMADKLAAEPNAKRREKIEILYGLFY